MNWVILIAAKNDAICVAFHHMNDAEFARVSVLLF